MIYPYMTLKDETEVVHTEMKPDGKVTVYFETPDEKDCFHHATCILPDYEWQDVFGYSEAKMGELKGFVKNNAHLILSHFRDETILQNSIL